MNKTGRSNTSKEGLESRALRKIAGAVCLSSKSSAALLAAAIQTPGVSQAVGCRPVGPVGWTIGLGSSAVATGSSVVASRLGLELPAWAGRVTRAGA